MNHEVRIKGRQTIVSIIRNSLFIILRKQSAMSYFSGKRVSNTLVTYLQDEDSSPKGELILDGNAKTQVYAFKVARRLERGLCLIS